MFTDASDVGIGGVLFQEQQGKLVPIRFLSKSLNDAQKRYSVTDREALAGYYCISMLRQNLLGRNFVWHTDHAALSTLVESTSPRVQRYRTALMEYSFEVRFLPGNSNDIADFLSRASTTALTANSVTAMSSNGGSFYTFLEEVVLSSELPSKMVFAIQLSQSAQIVNPKDKRSADALIEKVHGGENGHFGRDTTLRLLKRAGYVWKGMKSSVEDYIRRCTHCQLIHQTTSISGLPQTIDVPYPHYEWGLDAFEMHSDGEGKHHGLLMIDVYSRKIFTRAVTTLAAEEVHPILQQWLVDFGAPFQIRVDKSKSWWNGVIQPMLSSFNVQLTDTIAYGSVKGNGLTERYIKEVRDQLVVFERELRKSWSQCLPLVTKALNGRPMAALGFASPDEFMFGRMSPQDDYAHRVEIQDKIAAQRKAYGETLMQSASKRQKRRQALRSIPRLQQGQVIIVRNHRRAKKSPGDAHLRALPRTVISQDLDRIAVRNEATGRTTIVSIEDVLAIQPQEDSSLSTNISHMSTDPEALYEEGAEDDSHLPRAFADGSAPALRLQTESDQVALSDDSSVSSEDIILQTQAKPKRNRAKATRVAAPSGPPVTSVTSSRRATKVQEYPVRAIVKVSRSYPSSNFQQFAASEISILCKTRSGDLWYPLSTTDLFEISAVRDFVNADSNSELRDRILSDPILLSSWQRFTPSS